MVKDHRHQELAILPEYPSLAVEAEGTSTSTRLIQIAAAIGVGLLLILAVQYEVSRRRLSAVGRVTSPTLDGPQAKMASNDILSTSRNKTIGSDVSEKNTESVVRTSAGINKCKKICVVELDKTKKALPDKEAQCLSVKQKTQNAKKDVEGEEFTCPSDGKCPDGQSHKLEHEFEYNGRSQKMDKATAKLIYTIDDKKYTMTPLSAKVSAWHTDGRAEDDRLFQLTCDTEQ